MTTTFDPETTTVIFSDKYAGPIPKNYLHLFPKLKTVYLGENMKQKIGENEIPNKRFALFFPEGYPHLIGENIPEDVAVVSHGGDIDASEPEKFPKRHIFFEWISKSTESSMPGYFHLVPLPKSQRQRLTSHELFDKMCASAVKGFEDKFYDPQNNWLMASDRGKEGIADPEMMREIRSFSDYWDMLDVEASSDDSSDQEWLKRQGTFVRRDESEEDSDDEEPVRPVPVGKPVPKKPAIKKSVTDIEVLVTKDDINKMHKQIEERRDKEIKDAEDERLARLKTESKILALKIKADLVNAFEQDYLRKEYSRQYVLPDRERFAIFERLKKHLPGFSISRQGKCVILVSSKI